MKSHLRRLLRGSVTARKSRGCSESDIVTHFEVRINILSQDRREDSSRNRKKKNPPSRDYKSRFDFGPILRPYDIVNVGYRVPANRQKTIKVSSNNRRRNAAKTR